VTSCGVVGHVPLRGQTAAPEPAERIRRRLSWRPCHVTVVSEGVSVAMPTTVDDYLKTAATIDVFIIALF